MPASPPAVNPAPSLADALLSAAFPAPPAVGSPCPGGCGRPLLCPAEADRGLCAPSLCSENDRRAAMVDGTDHAPADKPARKDALWLAGRGVGATGVQAFGPPAGLAGPDLADWTAGEEEGWYEHQLARREPSSRAEAEEDEHALGRYEADELIEAIGEGAYRALFEPARD